MNIAEYIAGQLYKQGVKYVFGIPGGPSIPFLEALKETGIEFILTSHEASAGIMADVTARLTGIPGVCHATFGPGATNISTGVGGALLDRSPLLVFTSEMENSMLHRTTQMNIDHQELFSAITKATYRLNATNYADTMELALGVCRDVYPGPVHIGLPSDLCLQEAAALKTTDYVEEKVVSNNNVQKILSLLDRSRRPVMAIGLTSARAGIANMIISFLENWPMPVLLTPMAKGLIPEDHPCYAGVLFHALSDYLDDVCSDSDLVISIGYDPVEFNYESWLPDVPLIHFDTKKTDMPEGRNIVEYVGPPEEWMRILRNINKSAIVSCIQLLASLRDEMWSVYDGFTSHFGPSAALRILNEELPADTILTADVGSHLHLIGQFWKTHGKGGVIMTNGWSGMGFGIPSALAAQLVRRRSTIVCITGDGGFLMSGSELLTARRYDLPVIIVVFSDGELNLIKVKQSWQNLPPYGTTLYQGDLFGSDSFLGVKVLKAESHDEMRKAVIQALSANEPVIINAVIDPEEYKWLIVRR